jgi:hypothetical protein
LEARDFKTKSGTHNVEKIIGIINGLREGKEKNLLVIPNIVNGIRRKVKDLLLSIDGKNFGEDGRLIIEKVDAATGSEKAEEQNFEQIIGKEIVEKVIGTVKKFISETVEMLEKDKSWLGYKQETKDDILNGAAKETTLELLDKVIVQKSITAEIDKEKFVEHILKNTI